MAEISGQLEGPLTLECDLVMRGRVKGTVTVPSGSRLDLEGLIMGDTRDRGRRRGHSFTGRWPERWSITVAMSKCAARSIACTIMASG